MLDSPHSRPSGRCSAVAVASEERRSVVRRCSSLAARKTDRASLHRVPSVPREDLDFTFLLRKARARHAGAEAVHLGFLTQRCVPSRNEVERTDRTPSSPTSSSPSARMGADFLLSSEEGSPPRRGKKKTYSCWQTYVGSVDRSFG